MKKRILSVLMALALCLTLLPAPAWAAEDTLSGGTIVQEEQEESTPATSEQAVEDASEGGTIVQEEQEEATTEGNGQSTNTGEGEQSNSETGTLTEIWFVRKPDSIGRSYDGTTDGSMVSFGTPQFTDGTNTFELTEGTDFTAKKAFDSADAGNHTVTVEVTLIGEAAAKYKLKAGEETFTISGTINKAYPNLTVSLSETTCTVGEKLLPLLAVSGAPEDAAVTYYYTQYQTFAGDSEYEGSDVVPAIDENTAISEPGTYYVYAKSSETKNYDEERSDTVELTVNKAVVKAASVTKADGTNGGTYESLPAALNAAQDGDTVKLLANHTTNWSDVEASDLSTLAVVTKRLTLELNGWTVDYLEVGEVVPDEEGGILESTDGNLTIVDNIQDGSHGKIKDLQFVNGSLAIQSGQIGDSDGGKLTCNGNSGSVTVCGGTVLGLTVGEGASVTVSGGSTHAGFWFNDGTLTITGGTFGNVNFRNNGGTIAISGGIFSTIRNTGVSSNIPPMSLLAPGYAFYKDNAVQDGSKIDSLQDVTVKEHTHTMVNNKCACGFSCTHTNTKGVSTIGEDGKCTVCGTQLAAGIGETYYTDVKSALDAAADGQTVRLLANGMLPHGIYASKTLTLDLNGHSLSGYSLNVGGLTATSQIRTGNLTVIDSSGGNGAVGVTVRDGGTLVFDPENDSTTLLQLEVWGGKVELHGGKILRKDLRLNNSITLGDLLPQKAGLAYYCGDTQLTLAEAASKSCDLVVKSCAHGGKNGFDETATACPYCSAPAVAETALNNGEGSCLQRRFADLQTALDADRGGGATLRLLTDVTGDYTIDGTRDTGLDLNGHCIKGTVTVKAAAGSNTTTFSNTQNTTTASIDAVVAHRGAKLAGSRYPAVIGKLTLAEGATWKNILNLKTLGYKVLNADGTHKWYAPDDVNDSQLNNVIIQSLPITTKTLNLKVDGKNLTGSSPKVERGTTVQLCASCNTKGATVTFSILKTGETTPITLTEPSYAGGKYTKDYSFDTIGEYTIYFTAAKDGYTVQSSHKKLTVTKPNLSNAEITFRSSNESTYEPYRATTTAPGFTVTYNGKTLQLGVDYTASGTASSAGVSTQTLTIKAVEGSDYTGSKTAEWRIVPHKAKVEVGDVIKAYDGTTDLPDDKISLVSAAGSAGYQAGLPLPLSKGNGFELTDAKYDSANASETEKNISFTVKLTDTNYTFEDGTTEKAFTLNGAELEDKSFKIDQATVTPDEITLFVYNDVAKTYTLDLATLLPELTSGCEYGKIKYQGCDYHFTDSTYLDSNNGMFVSNEGILTLPIVAAHSADVNKQIGTITAPVVTANYQQFELTIKVVIGEKITPVQSDDFKISATGITYRQTLENSTLTVKGTMKDPTTGKEVKGTFAWLNKYDRPINTGDVYFDWTFTPDESYGGIYAAATGIVKVPVAPKSIEGAAITLEATSLEYNAAEQSPKITGVTLEDWDETRITYVIKSGGSATDVSDSITLTIEGTGNYTGTATVEWKITPKTVTPTMEVASCTYTGNALEPDVTLKDGDAVIPEGEYTAEYSNNTNAGTGRVAIKDVEGGNYIIASISRDFPIDQAAAPTNIQHGTLNVINGTQRTYTYDFQQLLPAAPHGDYGTVRYDLGNRQTAIHFTAHGYYIDPEIAEFEGSKLTLVGLYAKDGTATGQIGTATVTVTTTNYKDFRLTLVLNAVDRITPVADGSITASKITYGQTLSESRISGTMKDPTTGAAVEGTFAWQLPDDTILDASTLGHDIGWKFTPKDGNTYTEATGIAAVKVDKAQQYGKVSMEFYIYGETPSTPSLTDRTGDAKAQVTYYYNTTNSNSGGTEWKNIQPDTLSAGTRYYMYAELGETENYESFTTDCVKFWVMKAIPTCTEPTGLTAKYGQKLSQIALPNPEGNTPGTWRWQEPETVLDQLGTRSFYADFKPDNETYSEVLNVAIDVTVGPADGGSLKTVELAQKYTDTSEHTYKPDWSGLPGGQTWRYNSEYSVSTGSNVTLTKQDFAADGSLLTYAISGGKAGDKITLTLKASCDNYKDFTITLNITLTEKDDQKPLTITGNTSVIYGEKLTLTTSGGNGTGAVTYRIDTANSTGEAAIDPNTGVLTPVRVGSVSVIAAKAGDNDYNDVTSAPFVLMIKPATPTGEPNYTKITTGGKTLKDAALTTKGSTLNPNDGKLEWLDDKGNALPDDTRVKANTTYKWRFTPTDTNYTTLTGEIELLYHKSNGGGSSGYSYYTIEATAGAGGSISPSGSVSVREGGDQTFTITPDKGYAVSNVKIDGKSIGAVKSYTFENVSRTHTIEVIFVKGTASARTGDGSDLPLWSALLLASTLTLAGAVHYKRKRAR